MSGWSVRAQAKLHKHDGKLGMLPASYEQTFKHGPAEKHCRMTGLHPKADPTFGSFRAIRTAALKLRSNMNKRSEQAGSFISIFRRTQASCIKNFVDVPQHDYSLG